MSGTFAHCENCGAQIHPNGGDYCGECSLAIRDITDATSERRALAANPRTEWVFTYETRGAFWYKSRVTGARMMVPK